MNYYILDEDSSCWDCPYIREIPEELDMMNAILGKKIEVENLPIRIPVTITDESEVVYPDIMTADLPLFSNKLKLVFDNLGINNIAYYPVELIDEQSNNTKAHYFLAIILDLIDCLKSGVERSPAGRLILKNLVIDSTRVKNHRLFRLGEEPNLIIVDSYIKETIIATNLANVSLKKLTDYVSL
ncbi:hypothetical protein QMM42_13070 [Leptospira santarosai]|uniref:imm11 family protein n=1 Tax=Leptospira santarosai TaxID=28183 RepID=UPI000248B014|nr:DUF1629 domain-containing protein [Leptospira santarosai]MDI7187132.1 hypothetical protein [Leptospira santarosai]MDI7199460.1 hypothetical protein [Leptospira santarosai]MDI7207194.1 hypothetical protein [Leptospira santarosai]MDI7225073.1 hypothetical protein [Leptospira santarosai]